MFSHRTNNNTKTNSNSSLISNTGVKQQGIVKSSLITNNLSNIPSPQNFDTNNHIVSSLDPKPTSAFKNRRFKIHLVREDQSSVDLRDRRQDVVRRIESQNLRALTVPSSPINVYEKGSLKSFYKLDSEAPILSHESHIYESGRKYQISHIVQDYNKERQHLFNYYNSWAKQINPSFQESKDNIHSQLVSLISQYGLFLKGELGGYNEQQYNMLEERVRENVEELKRSINNVWSASLSMNFPQLNKTLQRLYLNTQDDSKSLLKNNEMFISKIHKFTTYMSNILRISLPYLSAQYGKPSRSMVQDDHNWLSYQQEEEVSSSLSEHIQDRTLSFQIYNILAVAWRWSENQPMSQNKYRQDLLSSLDSLLLPHTHVTLRRHPDANYVEYIISTGVKRSQVNKVMLSFLLDIVQSNDFFSSSDLSDKFFNLIDSCGIMSHNSIRQDAIRLSAEFISLSLRPQTISNGVRPDLNQSAYSQNKEWSRAIWHANNGISSNLSIGETSSSIYLPSYSVDKVRHHVDSWSQMTYAFTQKWYWNNFLGLTFSGLSRLLEGVFHLTSSLFIFTGFINLDTIDPTINLLDNWSETYYQRAIEASEYLSSKGVFNYTKFPHSGLNVGQHHLTHNNLIDLDNASFGGVSNGSNYGSFENYFSNSSSSPQPSNSILTNLELSEPKDANPERGGSTSVESQHSPSRIEDYRQSEIYREYVKNNLNVRQMDYASNIALGSDSDDMVSDHTHYDNLTDRERELVKDRNSLEHCAMLLVKNKLTHEDFHTTLEALRNNEEYVKYFREALEQHQFLMLD